MARYPAAIWKPIAAQYLPGRPLVAHNRVSLHVAVSEASSLHSYFSAPGRPSSHFYVRRDGTVEQYVDTDARAEADLEGNDATISVETQGGVSDPQGEPWTDQQVEALAQLVAWAIAAHGIAARLATDSRVGDSSKGLSWHRLGIDPWRVAGGMHYSSSRGKVCPGDAKIAQIPAILTRALAILGQPGPAPTSAPPAPTPPAPTPTPGGIDMSALPVLTKGSAGPFVRRMQGLLLANGYSIGKAGIDGSWGPSTDAGFTAFQKANPTTGTNGKPDHSCGPASWARLLGV